MIDQNVMIGKKLLLQAIELCDSRHDNMITMSRGGAMEVLELIQALEFEMARKVEEISSGVYADLEG